jgi:Fe2+ transport system protein B
MEAENAGLKGEILQLREALEKEKRSVADLASSSQGSSGQLAAEIKLLKESLENKERELQESQELLSKKDLELQDKLNEMAAKAAEATSDGNQNEANLRREIDKLTTENKYVTLFLGL